MPADSTRPAQVILAFDTSTARGGVAILKNAKTLSEITWERQGSHAELLTPAIEKCLTEAALKISDLDAIAIGQGPGSFTGVRVAINAARTLGFSLGIPTYVFDTTEILAAGIPVSSNEFRSRPEFHRLVTIVNAHKNSVYAAVFEFKNDDPGNSWIRTLPPTAVTADDLGTIVNTPHLCLGDGFLEYADNFSPALKERLLRCPSFSDFPLPTALGRLASMGQSNHSPLVWNDIQALYIRDSGAEEKLRESKK